jgi:hypothetical protein
MRNFLLTALFCGQLLLSAHADQLYVRNRPFKGEVVRQSGKTWVEIKALSEALGLKLDGDPQQGYQLAAEGEASPPGEGKAVLHGTEVPTTTGSTGLLVALEDACPLLGARLVANKAMGTLDVSLAPSTNPKSTSSPTSLLGNSAYTLVEYGVPGQALTEEVKPVFSSARSEFKNVEYRFCNAWNDADIKRYSRYTGSDKAYPAAYLLDREGKVLLQLRGNHVIEGELLKNLRKLVNVNL